MRKLKITFFAILSTLLVASCKKEEEVKPETGGLKITIYTSTSLSSENLLKNAEVKLLPAGLPLDEGSLTNALREGFTDSNGTIIFNDLAPGNYVYYYNLNVFIRGYVQVIVGRTNEYTYKP